MRSAGFKKYLFNCFILTIPVLVWNIAFANKLPADFQPPVFQADIPVLLEYGENISRTLVFITAALMPFSLSTARQKTGFRIYSAGLLLYFLAWLLIMYNPDSSWSKSLPGFLAPACTPLCWLIGIGMTGNSYFFGLPFKRWHFPAISITFVLFHCIHTYLIYGRTQP